MVSDLTSLPFDSEALKSRSAQEKMSRPCVPFFDINQVYNILVFDRYLTFFSKPT